MTDHQATAFNLHAGGELQAQLTKAVDRLPPAAAMRSVGALGVAGALALWTALVVVVEFDPSRLELGGSVRVALVYGVPVLLGAAMLFDARLASLPHLRIAAGWAALVVAAVLGTHRLSTAHAAWIVGIPAVVVAAIVLGRRPAIGMALAATMSGFYGSLIAFWKFPEEKTIQLVFGAVTLVLLWQLFVSGRPYAIRMTVGLALMLLYTYVTLVHLVLDSGNPAAGRGFMSSTWFMLALPLMALAGWPPKVLERMARAVVLVAGFVGAYAVYRWATHISVTEWSRWGADQYNYVGGKLRLIGSFPTGQALGGWTAAVVPFCLAMALTFRGRWRITALIAAALCLIALAGSQLRIAVVAVALGALVVVVLHEGSRGFAGLRFGTTATAVLVMVALGIAAFQITGGTTDKVGHSYSSLLHPFNRSDPSVDARIYKWEMAFRDLRGRPFGYGLGTANLDATNRLTSFESIGQYAIDNGYLAVALEQGLAIMVLFVLALLALTADLVRKALTLGGRVPAGITIGAAGTVVSFLILEWPVAFQDGPHALIVWIIAGLGMAQFTAVHRSESS